MVELINLLGTAPTKAMADGGIPTGAGVCPTDYKFAGVTVGMLQGNDGCDGNKNLTDKAGGGAGEVRNDTWCYERGGKGLNLGNEFGTDYGSPGGWFGGGGDPAGNPDDQPPTRFGGGGYPTNDRSTG